MVTGVVLYTLSCKYKHANDTIHYIGSFLITIKYKWHSKQSGHCTAHDWDQVSFVTTIQEDQQSRILVLQDYRIQDSIQPGFQFIWLQGSMTTNWHQYYLDKKKYTREMICEFTVLDFRIIHVGSQIRGFYISETTRILNVTESWYTWS